MRVWKKVWKKKNSKPAAASEDKTKVPSHNIYTTDTNSQARTLSDNAGMEPQIEKRQEDENHLPTRFVLTETEPIFEQGNTCLTEHSIEGDKSDIIPTDDVYNPVVNDIWTNPGIKYEEGDSGKTDFLPKDTSSSNDFIRDNLSEMMALEDFTPTSTKRDPKILPESESTQTLDLREHEIDASIESVPQNIQELERVKEGISKKSSIPPISLSGEALEEAHDHSGTVASFCCPRDEPDFEALILKYCPNNKVSDENIVDVSIGEPMDDLFKLPTSKEDIMDKSIGYTSIWGKRRYGIIGEEDLVLLKYNQRTHEEVEDGNVITTEKSDILKSDEYGRVDQKESIMEDKKDTSGTTPGESVNKDFAQGLDGIDNLFEEVEPPDELDIGAAGSSMQDVLIGQGIQILKERVAIFISRVKKSFTATSIKKFLASRKSGDGKLVILKRDEMQKLWKHVSTTFKTTTERIEYFLDNLFYGEESQNFEVSFSETEKDLESIRKKMIMKNKSF